MLPLPKQRSCLPSLASLAVRVRGIKFAENILISVQLLATARHLGAWGRVHEERNAVAVKALGAIVLNPMDRAFQRLVCPQREQVLRQTKVNGLWLNEVSACDTLSLCKKTTTLRQGMCAKLDGMRLTPKLITKASGTTGTDCHPASVCISRPASPGSRRVMHLQSAKAGVLLLFQGLHRCNSLCLCCKQQGQGDCTRSLCAHQCCHSPEDICVAWQAPVSLHGPPVQAFLAHKWT